MDYAREIALYHNGPQHRTKLKRIIDLVIQIGRYESIFLRNSTINFRILYVVTCFMWVTVSLLCRGYKLLSKIHVPIYPYLISEGRGNCPTLWPAKQGNRDSQETKHVNKYKHMINPIVEFLIEFENRGIKIARVNSICITKSINLL